MALHEPAVRPVGQAVMTSSRTLPALPPDTAAPASCHEASAPSAPPGSPVVALVGSPNAGKSTLFNALTGAGRAVGNYPGTSVEVGSGKWQLAGVGAVQLTDLPGAYSLSPVSPDEALTRELLSSPERVAAVVLVCDAAHLGRSLVLAANVRELPVRVVVALTMLDVAARRGSAIDVTELARRIGVPVVAVDPRRRDQSGLCDLAEAVARVIAQPLPAPLGVAGAFTTAPVPAQATGSDVPDCCSASVPAAGAHTPPEPPPDGLAGAQALFDWVTTTTDAVVVRDGGDRRTLSDRVDAWATAPVLGPILFLALMWGVFTVTTRIAQPLQGAMAALFSGPVSAAASDLLGALGLGGGLLEGLVVTGLIAGVGMLLTFVPLMAIMFALLALLEDSGYMARAAVVTDRMMGMLGLPGRAFLPLVVGFGCNVPAISAVRVLPDARHRILTAMLVPFTSCSARLTVYVMVAATFFPDHAGTVVFAMYLTSILLVVLGGLLLRRTLFQTMGNDPLVLDLPPYQRPHLPVLWATTSMRVRGFLRTASGIIVTTVAIVWFLGEVPGPGSSASLGAVPIGESLYAWIADQASVLFTFTGFAEWHAVGALMVGFVAKEAVISSWAQTYAAGASGTTSPGLGQGVWTDFAASSGGHPQAAALAFLVFLLAYTPCVATLAAQKRQIGLRWTGIGVAMQLAVAWVLAVVVFQGITAFS